MDSLDNAYLPAIEGSDIVKAQALVEAAAKKAGYTIGPVLHNSRAIEPFHAFETKYGAYFTTNPQYAESFRYVAQNFFKVANPKTYSVYIRLTNPEIFDGENNDDFLRYTDTREPSADVANRGFDGQILRFRDGHADYRINRPIPDEIVRCCGLYGDDGALIPLSKNSTLTLPDIRGHASAVVALNGPSTPQKPRDTSVEDRQIITYSLFHVLRYNGPMKLSNTYLRVALGLALFSFFLPFIHITVFVLWIKPFPASLPPLAPIRSISTAPLMRNQ